MFGLLRFVFLAFAVLFPLAAPAHGWGHRRGAVASYGSYYYYPGPVSYYPSYYPASYYYYGPSQPVVYPQQVPVIAAPVWQQTSPPVYAVPTPAPAISSPVPSPPAPAVKESKSSYQEARSYYRAVPANGQVTVSFWNRSGRDLDVQIAGEWRRLGQGRGLTLDLPREFAWQVQGRDAQLQRIPAPQTSSQIVIR